MPIRYRRSRRNEKVVGVISALIIAGSLWYLWMSNTSVKPEECVDDSMIRYYMPEVTISGFEGFGDEYRDLRDKLSDEDEVIINSLDEMPEAVLPPMSLPGLGTVPMQSYPPSNRTVNPGVILPPTGWLWQPGVVPNPSGPGGPGGGGNPPCHTVSSPGSMWLILIGFLMVVLLRGKGNE